MRIHEWQDRLSGAFSAIRTKRERMGDHAYVFALEHQLDDTELTNLFTSVNQAFQQDTDISEYWLPCAVVAAEIGYEFSGYEYWQTFEERLPAWKMCGNRKWISDAFERFKQTYRGISPSGAWAMHFRIIAWPITNAILPLDLQRQFLESLYRLRPLLRDEHFEDPELLAATIEARSLHLTDRFANFLNNRALVWQFSSALLAEQLGENRELISERTLRRIVSDLGRERASREWLREIRRQTRQLITHGVTKGRRDNKRSQRKRSAIKYGNMSPQLQLRPNDEGEYSLYAIMPEFGALLSSDPELKRLFQNVRCQVRGAKSSSPFSRGHFLYRREVRLSEWPESNVPMLEPIDCHDNELRELFENITIRSRGNTWLFKLRSDGTAAYIRGGTLRPGSSYILISKDQRLPDINGTTIKLASPGVSNILFDVSDSGISPFTQNDAQRLGLKEITYLDVWPAGVSPSQWDGEGYIEWLSTDRPIIAVRANKEIESISIALEGFAKQELTVPIASAYTHFIELPRLYTGSYTLKLLTHSSTPEYNSVTAEISINIREPQDWSMGSSPCNPLMVLTDPIQPSYEDIWNGDVDIAVQGPVASRITFIISFFDRRGILVLESAPIDSTLPVTIDDWRELFVQHVRRKWKRGETDPAHSCRVVIRGGELGDASISAERQVSALRWSVQRKGKSNIAMLIDDTDSLKKQDTCYFTSEFPDISVDLDYEKAVEGMKVTKRTVLFHARANGDETSFIVSPSARLLSLKELRFTPQLKSDVWQSGQTISAMRLLDLWANAKTLDDLKAVLIKRSVVLNMLQRLFAIFGGAEWLDMECQYANRPERVALKRMLIELSDYWKFGSIAHFIFTELDQVSPLATFQRKSWFEYALEKHRMFQKSSPFESITWFSELCLRVASDPGTVSAWADEKLVGGITALERYPVLPLLARYFVLSVEERLGSQAGKELGALYSSWRW